MIKRILNAIGSTVVRIYALVILLVLIWTGYVIVAYLVQSVFRPAEVPKRFVEWQGHLEADALRVQDTAGMTRLAMRAPIGHYHRVGRWFQADPHNGCTTAGCHSPMPHVKQAAVRAFSNFHATFLTCQMCHGQAESKPVPAAWIATATGRRQDPPAMLKLAKYLEDDYEKIKSEPASAHPIIVDLLKKTVEITGTDAVLDYLLLQINTSEPGSPAWRGALTQLAVELPLHQRGEYGAKLAPEAVAHDYLRIGKQLVRQAKQYLAAEPETTLRRKLKTKMHTGLLDKPDSCLACHGMTPPLLDFAKLGYSSKRTKALSGNPLASQMEKLRRGESFKLPTILGGR